MKIIIFGANEVGAMIASQFYTANDITVIDNEKNKLDVSVVSMPCLELFENQTSAYMKKIRNGMNPYESPEIVLETIENEGLLCASGTHQGFTESDDWIDILEEE